MYWYAVNDGHVYIYRELHINQTIASEVARQINNLSKGENISYYVASPDMWQKRGVTDSIHGANIADSFMMEGIPLIKADNARIVGWQRVHEYLADSADGTPYLQIFCNCINLVKHLPQLIHDKNKVEDVSTEPHEITNSTDSMRYGLMSQPSPNKAPVVSVYDKTSTEYFVEQHRLNTIKNSRKKVKNGWY